MSSFVHKDEKSLFTRLLIIIIVISLTVFPFIFDSFTVSKLLVACIGLLIFSIQIIRYKNTSSLNKVPIWLFFIITIFGISLFVSWIKSDVPFIRGAFGQFGRGNGLIYYFIVILIFIFSAKTFNVSKSGIENRLIEYFSMFLIFYATLQRIGIDIAQLDTRGISPVVLTFGNSNFAGGMLSVLFVYHLVYNLVKKEFTIRSFALLFLLIVSSTFPAAVQGYLLIVFGIFIAFSLYILERENSHWASRAVGVAWISGILAVILGLMGKFILASVFSRTSFQARIEYWRISIRIIRDNLMFGVGPDKLFDVTSKYMSPGSLKLITLTRMDSSHNWYLNLAANYGIITLVFFILLILCVFIIGFRNIFISRKYEALPTAAFAAFIAIFIDGLVSIEQPGIGVWLYLFAGIVVGDYLKSKREILVSPEYLNLDLNQNSFDLFKFLTFVCIASLTLVTLLLSGRVIEDASLRKAVQTESIGKGTVLTLQTIASYAEKLRAEPEYSVQALNSLASAGDGAHLDRVSKSIYEYNRRSIQATLIRADVLRALGRNGEACPLRIALLRNSPWDMLQLHDYLICRLGGLKDPNYLDNLRHSLVYIPYSISIEAPSAENDLAALNIKLKNRSIEARINYILGNLDKAYLVQKQALELLSAITKLERTGGVVPLQPERNDNIQLLSF